MSEKKKHPALIRVSKINNQIFFVGLGLLIVLCIINMKNIIWAFTIAILVSSITTIYFKVTQTIVDQQLINDDELAKAYDREIYNFHIYGHTDEISETKYQLIIAFEACWDLLLLVFSFFLTTKKSSVGVGICFFVWIFGSLYIDKQSRMFRHYNAGQATKHKEYEQWLKEDLKQRKEETRKYKQRQKLEKKQKIEETKEAKEVKEVKNTMQKSDLF